MEIAQILIPFHAVARRRRLPGVAIGSTTSAVSVGEAETAGGELQRPYTRGERPQLGFDPDAIWGGLPPLLRCTVVSPLLL